MKEQPRQSQNAEDEGHSQPLSQAQEKGLYLSIQERANRQGAYYKAKYKKSCQKVLKQLQGIPAKLSVWDVWLLGRELREALITALQDPAAYEAFLSEL